MQRHNTPTIFDWLIDALSYQGVSDSIAYGYMEQHGRVRWHDIAGALAGAPSCSKLRCYWAFEGCRYLKGAGSCANPEHQPGCPLPRHDLRNGRLNQTTYSLFLFMRDLADGDFVGWIDQRLAAVDPMLVSERPARLRQALLDPLGNIYGVSNKVLAMSLAELLLGGDAKRPIWIEAGTVMIAIDTLVHNFLHRTGILRDLRADHLYGPGCYAPAGCAAIIERIAGRIDARRFNPAYPANFPRFVQHAIWQFCAESGLNRCKRPAHRRSHPLRADRLPGIRTLRPRAAQAGVSAPKYMQNGSDWRSYRNMLQMQFVPDMFMVPRIVLTGRGARNR